jgi:hypothetical protein
MAERSTSARASTSSSTTPPPALVEFVEVGGVAIPQENQIVQTFQFTP